MLELCCLAGVSLLVLLGSAATGRWYSWCS